MADFFHQDPCIIAWKVCKNVTLFFNTKENVENVSIYLDLHQKLMGSILAWNTASICESFWVIPLTNQPTDQQTDMGWNIGSLMM